MKKIAQVLLLAGVAVLPSAPAQTVSWTCSRPGAPWVVQAGPTLATNRDQDPYDLVVHLDQPRQRIDGWGGCFNELGWTALQVLPRDAREGVLRNLFEPGRGLNFTLCRMPIGASDYATNWYSLDDTPGDFDLQNFSLDRDRTLLLPYLKAAQKYQPALKVWGSPWSPPVWLKVNRAYGGTGTNRLIQDARHLNTLAHYLARYVQSYRAEGVDIFAVAVQNEPFASQVFPSCQWSPEELRDFIGEYVGPVFRQQKVEAQIWLGTFNNNRASAFTSALSDPRAAQYISAIGLQWAGKDALPALESNYPRVRKIQTESECGDGSFDWAAAEHTFGLMKFYFNHGVGLYSYWNMVLDNTGLSAWGWRQNALVTVDRKSRTATCTPEYYLFQHFSHFIPASSVRIACEGNFDDALAFRTPSGSLELVLLNQRETGQSVSIMVGDRNFTVQLPPQSMNTFGVPAPSTAP